MTKSVKNFGDYTVTFEAEKEYVGMRHHFIRECGWTASQFAKIKNFAWFCAKVSIWKSGVELATDYLGCCYKSENEFFTLFESDYFSDMVHNCASEIADAALLQAVNAWREAHHAERDARIEHIKATL